MFSAESRDFAGEIRHAVGLSGADGDVSSQFPLLPLELLLRLFRQLHNLLGPAAQEQQRISLPVCRAISPFVPISISK